MEVEPSKQFFLTAHFTLNIRNAFKLLITVIFIILKESKLLVAAVADQERKVSVPGSCLTVLD
jgi:hypothetical protein